MRQLSFLRRFSRKAAVLSLFTLAACVSAHADNAAFSNFNQVANSSTNGTQVGMSILVGAASLTLTDVQFPQLDANTGFATSGYNAAETFGIYSRNADGTLGQLLYPGFTLTNTAATSQTIATAVTPYTLAANTGYWLVLSSPTTTAWTYTLSTTYTSNGLTLPTTNTSYESGGAAGATGAYFNLASGPQLAVIDVVPEPSSYCLLAVAGAGALVLVRRARQSKVA